MAERVVALAVLVASGVYFASALPLPMGTAARPGAGFFPLGVGTLGLTVALVWVGLAFRRVPAAPGPSAAPGEDRTRVLATAATLVGFCLLLPWTGYPLTAFLFVTVLLRSLGAGWRGALVAGASSAAVSYYLFAVLLTVPLPRGALFD